MSLKTKTEKKEEPEAEPKEELRAPDGWVVPVLVGEAVKREMVPKAHAVANSLYGWSRQAYHYGADSFKISFADYEKAVKAAMAYPATPPHSRAIPPISEAKFKASKR